MGGWIAFAGDDPAAEERIDRLRSRFAVAEVPELRIEQLLTRPDFQATGWAWHASEIPDVHAASNDEIDLLVCGAVTEIRGTPVTHQSTVAPTIADLWSQTGSEIVADLNGSFSLLIWNRQTRHLQALTDRFASRSVWFARDDQQWIVANFPTAIAACCRDSLRLDPAGLWSLLHMGRPIGTGSLFAGFQSLLAGHSITLPCDGRTASTSWRERRYQPEHGVTPAEWGGRLSSALSESAGRYENTTSSCNLFLSGGMDSRIAAAAYPSSLNTITLCTQPNAESRFARHVSRRLGLNHQVLQRSADWYLRTFDVASLISGGNYLLHHAHFTIPVTRIVSENPQAAFLLGDMLENFNKHYFSTNGSAPTFEPRSLSAFLASHVPSMVRNRSEWGSHLRPELRDTIEQQFEDQLRQLANGLMEVSSDTADRLNTLLRWNSVSSTYTFNMITNIWPLARERNICFDNHVDDLSLAIPSSIRGQQVLHNWTLYHLNKSLLLVPDANDFLPPVVPKRLKRAVKTVRPILGRLRRRMVQRSDGPVTATSGSWLLLHELYRKDPQYRDKLDGIFEPAELFPDDVFDTDQVRKTWHEYNAGNIGLHFQVESLLTFALLHQQFGFTSLAC